ncbi:uncharacterized protein N7473_004776 [Penicillium subrubescens]|jgi:hypothetical protein|uniref:uncharacterized protein n=1 Tax=Penicillium subrubescens TaxID=1316194 RepID=UPI002545A94B|nr:uncharacterized protein N7473_004776 [Penicillium subrubescens]KAJ5900706.1 hypothetical protein N7473_004776 [Penicillium subrubescens]
MEEKEVESSVQCEQCIATAKVTPERLGADAIQYRVTTSRKLRPSLSTQLSYRRSLKAQPEH